MNRAPRPRPFQQTRRRSGFSLLEILLVVGVLAAVGMLAYPLVSNQLENNRLRFAGEEVRAALARARNEAMGSGRTYVFRCQLNTGSYVVEPWVNNDDLLESDLVTMGGAAVGESTQELAALQVGPQAKTLPEDVTFAGSETVGDARQQLLAATADSATEAESNWSTPIFCYPDGTCSTARIVLRNLRDRYVLLTLRGLTGVVTTRGLLAADQLPR